ncbi:uncharacterized protein LOC111088309 [Limulus polyphemus]|uniref:Uncharacterized protein LOC111088309 n=1 Tax=Limulus polyphemus TaxID=6850 RepID=A0ABM1TCY6_LIMPO|nr:uncharacterized protein LOC111088309 [Limulus polyphemus]
MKRAYTLITLIAALSFSCLSVASDHFVDKSLPSCRAKGVCGYVQVNPYGVSSEQFCRCPQGSCPLTTDLFDGKTVPHGYDQYKFCDRQPQLHVCQDDEAVYSYKKKSFVYKDTFDVDVRIRCLCPSDHVFVKNDTKFFYGENTSFLWIQYNCRAPNICNPSDTCRTVTESYDKILHRKKNLVSRQCVCPEEMYCPHHLELAFERVDFGKGGFYQMRCMQDN